MTKACLRLTGDILTTTRGIGDRGVIERRVDGLLDEAHLLIACLDELDGDEDLEDSDVDESYLGDGTADLELNTADGETDDGI